MDPLQSYIALARQQGINDAQIAQALITAGWPTQNIYEALNPGSTYPQSPLLAPQPIATNLALPQVKSHKNSLVLVTSILLLIFLVIGVSYLAFVRRPSPQSVVNSFVKAMNNKDQLAADNLESPAARTYYYKNAGTTSYYKVCYKAGTICTSSFQSSFLSKASITTRSYVALNGTKGSETIYTVKQSVNAAIVGGSGCVTSTDALTIAVVPKGHSWQVDFVDQNISAVASSCGATPSNS